LTRIKTAAAIDLAIGRKSGPGVANLRKVGLPRGRRWLGVESRSVIPFAGFDRLQWGAADGRRRYEAAVADGNGGQRHPTFRRQQRNKARGDSGALKLAAED